MTPPGEREGLLGALQNTAATLVAIVQTRLELLSNEIETQKLTALRMFVLAVAMMFCAGTGILLVVALLTLLLWEQRVAVLSVFALLFVAGAVWCYRAVMRLVDTPEPPFAATLAELHEDLRRLKAASGHAAPD